MARAVCRKRGDGATIAATSATGTTPRGTTARGVTARGTTGQAITGIRAARGGPP